MLSHSHAVQICTDNPQVIVAVARVYRHLAPPDRLSVISGPLVSLLRAPVDVQHMALINIVSVALEYPHLFTQFATHFLVHATDPPYVWRLKLEVLTLIFPHATAHTKNLILSELEYFAKGYDKELVKEAVRAIGRCAQSQTKNAARCLRLLLRQVESSDGTLVAESLTVIRHIIQQDPGNHAKTVVRLAKALDTATDPSARASIIWLVGEFAGINDGNNVAADTLRILAKDFHSESEQAKSQIVLLAAKVYAHHLNRTQPAVPTGEDRDEEDRHPISLLFSYILLLARYDLSYDLRDRARLYKSILSTPSSTQLATLLLLAPKPTPQAPSPSSGREEFTLGSAAMVLGKDNYLMGYEPLPEWVTPSRAPSPSLREILAVPGVETPRAGPSAGGAMAMAVKGTGVSGSPLIGSPKAGSPVLPPRGKTNGVQESLEDFLASDEETGEESEETDGTGEEGSEEESEGESEEEEEEDDEDEEEGEGGEGEEEDAKLLGAKQHRV